MAAKLETLPVNGNVAAGGSSGHAVWTFEVVIATCNRPDDLSVCLRSLNRQQALPERCFIVDSSLNQETQARLDSLRDELRFPCSYDHSKASSAARQRNLGAALCTTDLILFLDDDVILEQNFTAEIVDVFRSHPDGSLGGVSGTITNQTYSDPRGINRLLLGFCVGKFQGSYAGKVLGPAINFLPGDGAEIRQDVAWLPTTCTAYRRDVFMTHQFEQSFTGYSFAEDVHLSTRIAQSHRLMNTTRARVFHADRGKDTHRDWAALGESQVRNRHLIMTSVLGRNRLIDHLRLFGYEMVYSSLTWIAAGSSMKRLSQLGSLLRGKLRGFAKLMFGAGRA